MVKVVVGGCFDILHPGHIFFLRKAKEIGGQRSKLIVVVARDSTIERVKGRKPIFDENSRLLLVSNLRMVDKAVLGYEGGDFTRIIVDLKPDIIVLGYDQKINSEKLKEALDSHGLKIKIVRVSERKEGFSSSSVRKKILDTWCKK